jgi:3-hydroxyisobutyrate dehydrogenase
MEIAANSDFDNPMGSLAQALYQQHADSGNGQRDFSSILEKLKD